jgi:UDP:flavonoid glycosyltransferase YjiC (YdhE family)
VAISLAEAEAGSITSGAPALEEHQPGLVEALRASPYLSRFPASLDPSPFPSTVRYQEPVPPPTGPLPDWWPGAKDPLIYMTFGTVLGHMSFAADVYTVALKAVEGLAIRVLLTVGRRFDVSLLGDVPSNVHVEAWVDQDDVLPHADVVISHGGSGTSYGALAAGIPLVLVPVFADQFENGRRIADRGAGLMVEPGEARIGERRVVVADEDAPRIAEAIERVLATPDYREAAESIAREMASGPTPADVLEGLLPVR